MSTADEFYGLDDGDDALSAHLPYGPFVAPGVILLEDEDALVAAIEYVPRDAAVMDPDEIMQIANAVGHVVFPFTSGWTLHFEYRRHEDVGYPRRLYVNEVSSLIDVARARRLDAGNQLTPRTFISVTYTPAHVREEKVGRFFTRNPPERQVQDAQRDHVEPFYQMMQQFAGMMSRAVGYAKFLDDNEFKGLISGCIDPDWMDGLVAGEEEGQSVKYDLATLGFVPGKYPRLDNGVPGEGWHLAVIGMTGFPSANHPGFMNVLNGMDFPLRYTVRFDCLDHLVARGVFASLWRKHDDTAFDWRSVLIKSVGGVEAVRRDTVGMMEAMEAEAARMEIEATGKSAGYMTQTVIVWGRTEKERDERRGRIVKELKVRGFKPILEGYHAERVFMGTLPGLVRPNKRRVPVPQVTMGKFVVTSAPYTGPRTCGHPRIAADALMLANGPGGTAIWFDPYYGEDGSILLVGPPRTGKSTAMAFMGHQFLARYPGGRVVWLDVDAAESTSMVATWMAGGQYMSFGPNGLSLQPLAEVHTPEGFAWAYDLIMDIFRLKGVVGAGNSALTEAAAGVYLTSALRMMASPTYPAHERAFTYLHGLIQKRELREALDPYCRGGAYGDMVDGESDEIATTSWLTVDIGALIDREAAAAPVIRALFRRFYRMFESDHRPTLFIVDEGYKPIANNPTELEEIRRRGPKKGVALMLCTHNLEDVEGLSITPMLRGMQFTIALPDSKANIEASTEAGSAYERFGFNWAMRDTVATMAPRDEVFIKGPLGAGKVSLGLGAEELAVCGCGAADRNVAIDLYHRYGPEGFKAAWFRHKGLTEMAEQIEEGQRYAAAAE